MVYFGRFFAKLGHFAGFSLYISNNAEAVDMNGRFQMQGGKNWFLPKEMNANRFFWDSHWLEIWSNHFYPSMGPNGGSVAMDSVRISAAATGGAGDIILIKKNKTIKPVYC